LGNSAAPIKDARAPWLPLASVDFSTVFGQDARKLKKTFKKRPGSSKRLLHAGQWRDFEKTKEDKT
jgi:hypothetical protein